jgi:riboflavin synthase
MFTGIITGMGRIVAIHDLGRSLQHGKRLTIEAPAGYLDDVGLGDSIALNGACMTVTTFQPENRQFTIDISASPAPSTSKKPCAPTTAWADTSCPAMSMVWAP